MERHVLRLNDKVACGVLSLQLRGEVAESRGCSTQLAAPSGRAWADGIVEASRAESSGLDGTDTAGLTASSAAAKVRGLHASVVSADGAVAVTPRLVGIGLQPELQVGEAGLAVGRCAALHFEIGDAPVEVAETAAYAQI